MLRIWTCQLQSYPSGLALPRGIPGRRRCFRRRAYPSTVGSFVHAMVAYICAHASRKYIIYTRIWTRAYNYGNRPAGGVYRQLHRRFYFPSATPQLRVSQPQNVSSPSLYSPVKLDFIGLLSILRSQKVLPAEAITAVRIPLARTPFPSKPKICLRSDRSGAVRRRKNKTELPIAFPMLHELNF